MRIVSLLPFATEIICEIGLGDELVGVSGDSDWPPEVRDRPAVTRVTPGGRPKRTDDRGRLFAATHGMAPGHDVDQAAILELRPDLVVTQERCRICGVPVRPIPSSRELALPFAMISLEPSSIEGIFNAITTVGAMTEAEDDAIDLVESLRARLGAVEETVERRRDDGHRAIRTVLLQRLNPPATAGHWVPEQVRRAGGWELLGEEGAPAAPTSWEAVREVDPEVLLLAPASQRIAVARASWERTSPPAAWRYLTAVTRSRVFLLDGQAYFARPGPRIIDGIELLAEVLDPEGFVDASPPGSWTPVDG